MKKRSLSFLLLFAIHFDDLLFQRKICGFTIWWHRKMLADEIFLNKEEE